MSIDDLVEYKKHGRPFPPNAFTITFDDGFENNYSIAAPVLEDLKVPAMFYVTSGFVQHNYMSWIDRIELCLEESGSVQLNLPWHSELVNVNSCEQKIEILDEIRLEVKSNADFPIELLIEGIYYDCGRELVNKSSDPLDQKMNWKEVTKLNQHELFRVGGHSHYHSILSFLEKKSLEQEIAFSLRLLKENAGVEAEHYSYPEGLAHCYSEDVISELKSHGVYCCPSAIDGIAKLEDDLFHLPRVMAV